MPKMMLHDAEARAALARGVAKLTRAVSGTLGPKGMNGAASYWRLTCSRRAATASGRPSPPSEVGDRRQCQIRFPYRYLQLIRLDLIDGWLL